MREKLLLLGLLSFAPALAYACGEPHLVGAYPYKQLIDEADSIAFVRLKRVDDVNSSTNSNGPKEVEGRSVADVIAAARSAQQNRPKVRYIFDVIEMLWGVEKRELVVETYLSSQISKQHDFDRHEDYRFWLDDGGATLVSSACDLVPRFEKDKAYLIVLGARASRKSYELVRNPERDAWYKEVKRLVLLRE